MKIQMISMCLTHGSSDHDHIPAKQIFNLGCPFL